MIAVQLLLSKNNPNQFADDSLQIQSSSDSGQTLSGLFSQTFFVMPDFWTILNPTTQPKNIPSGFPAPPALQRNPSVNLSGFALGPLPRHKFRIPPASALCGWR